MSRPAALDGVQSWTITTRGGRGGVNLLAHSPNGKFLAAVHEDNVVRLLNPAGEVVHAFVVHNARVRALAWSPDKAEPTLAVADDGAFRAHMVRPHGPSGAQPGSRRRRPGLVARR